MKFKSNIEAQAKVFIGDLASANATRFPNALSVTSIVPSGVQHNESLYIGLMAEALSVGTTWASGIYGAGYTNASGSGRGTGVTGEGHVSAATDTGVAVGVRGYANDVHSGNYNIGLYGDAENGDPGLTYGGNVALFLANGNIVTSSAVNKNWFLGGNLTFNGQGASKIISATNGAKFDFGGTSSQFVKGDGSLDSNVYAIDSTVVHKTGNENITGIKSFDYSFAPENFSTRINYYFASGGIRSNVTPISIVNNNSSQVVFSADEVGVTANSFIKIGGNSTQYLKADGSVSTAMNSRIEVNFIATSGQTTFTTPYEVGQIDVYYNGSKLYPNEFTATNGTDVVLATAATLNAQISIVKYVAALSTTAIRNETTFTATSGQTTFSVNYTVGQLDVFYNGSKLNVSEFTATNGTSVVLGFACQTGESVVFVSYVNQVSGASGTANRVAKFTGAATLGDSLIFDNGANVAIGTTTPASIVPGVNLTINGGSSGYGSLFLQSNSVDRAFFSADATNVLIGTAGASTNMLFYTGGSERMRIASTGNVSIGTTTDPGAKLNVNGAVFASGLGGFASATYQTGTRNPIWRFGNADGYGLSFFQGTAGYGGNDEIGIHFGTATAAGSQFQFLYNGNYIFSGGPISDRRAKENIKDLTFNATEKVMALQSRSYYMKEGNKKIKYGFIAQEVYEILPDLISGDLEEDSIVGLDYNGLIPVLVKAMQEHQAQIKELQDELVLVKNK